MKSLFKSKTAAVAFLTTLAGAVAAFVPEVGEWVKGNSPLILMALGGANVILRLVTNKAVSLFSDDA